MKLPFNEGELYDHLFGKPNPEECNENEDFIDHLNQFTKMIENCMTEWT